MLDRALGQVFGHKLAALRQGERRAEVLGQGGNAPGLLGLAS